MSTSQGSKAFEIFRIVSRKGIVVTYHSIFRHGSDDIYDQKYYRSVHYILKYRGMYLEVQVRTLFEEGWGEIDHHILYPYKKQNPMLTEFSELLNRLAGMGDEMASFYRRLQDVPGDAFLDKKSMTPFSIVCLLK